MLLRFALFLILTFPAFCIEGSESPHVIVSIAPYKYFVERIGGETIKVDLMVPPGGSPHTYEPSAKQVISAGKADIWFKIGEEFENRAIPAIKSHNPKMEIIDLRNQLDLICEPGHTGCSRQGADPHVWLSPRMAKEQAEAIAQALGKRYPENREKYRAALQAFMEELEELDREIEHTLKPMKQRVILVSHPAFAYFARDYQIKQLSIEFEGKDPSPKQVGQIFNLAKTYKIGTIFVQAQHAGKGARLIAEQIGAEVVELDPLSEHYIANMKSMAKKFAQSTFRP